MLFPAVSSHLASPFCSLPTLSFASPLPLHLPSLALSYCYLLFFFPLYTPSLSPIPLPIPSPLSRLVPISPPHLSSPSLLPISPPHLSSRHCSPVSLLTVRAHRRHHPSRPSTSVPLISREQSIYSENANPFCLVCQPCAQRMAKKKSKRVAAPADAAKGSTAEAAGKSAAVASAPVEGREADNEGTEEAGAQQATESRRVQKRAAKQTRLMDNLRRTQTLIAAARGESKTKKASKKKKKGAVSNLPTTLTLDTLASSLGDALPDALALGKEAEKRQAVLSAKQRGKIVVEETRQMAAVLSHPAFKANPFTAIQQHLSNTLPSSVAPPPLPTKFATRQAQQALEKKRKKKKAKKKAGGGVQHGEDAMEM
ncbi:unnamed protein product [Closterium sp. Yama58-4]|nr:unnamed protein product [Closterium sp. Yama58-4]